MFPLVFCVGFIAMANAIYYMDDRNSSITYKGSEVGEPWPTNVTNSTILANAFDNTMYVHPMSNQSCGTDYAL